MSKLSEFNELLSRSHYNLETRNRVAIRSDGFMGSPSYPTTSFKGIDVLSRAYVCLSVACVKMINGELYPWRPDYLVVFQKEYGNDHDFCTSYNLVPLTFVNFLTYDATVGATFWKLERLLNGETLRFHANAYNPDYPDNIFNFIYDYDRDDPHNYIEVTWRKV